MEIHKRLVSLGELTMNRDIVTQRQERKEHGVLSHFSNEATASSLRL
jgi:hypothetical protein